MVVQAAWPGATVEDTLKQVTERLERQQETPLDPAQLLRPGVTTIFVNLQAAPPPRKFPTSAPRPQEHRRSGILAGRHVAPGFNDEFGDAFGIIYGFTPMDSPIASFAITSRTSVRSSCTCATSRRSKSWALRTRRYSSSSRCSSSPAWVSIARLSSPRCRRRTWCNRPARSKRATRRCRFRCPVRFGPSRMY